MKVLDHIGIAVRNIQAATTLFETLLGISPDKCEDLKEGLKVVFFKVGTTKLELIEAKSDSHPLARFIEKKGEGLHHIAFRVEHIEAARTMLINHGFTPLKEGIQKGADNKLVCFFHPKTTQGVLIELCQSQ